MNFQINPCLYKAMHAEISNWKKDAEIINTLGEFSDVPLVVIGRDKEHSIRLGIEEGLSESELTFFKEKWEELIMN